MEKQKHIFTKKHLILSLSLIILLSLMIISHNDNNTSKPQQVAVQPKCSNLPVIVKFNVIDSIFLETIDDYKIELRDSWGIPVTNVSKNTFIINNGKEYEYTVEADGYWTESGKVFICKFDESYPNVTIYADNKTFAVLKEINTTDSLLLLYYEEIPIILEKKKGLILYNDYEGCPHIENHDSHKINVIITYKNHKKDYITLSNGENICLNKNIKKIEYLLEHDYYFKEINSSCECPLQ